MTNTTEQMLSTTKASAAVYFDFATKAFDGMQKLVELNLQTARTALAESAALTEAAMSSKDPQGLMSLQVGVLQAAVDKVGAYSRHVYDISASTGSEFKAVAETVASEAQAKFMAAAEAAAKNSPAGDQSLAAVKASMSAANTAYETMQKAVKQASDTAEASFQTISATAAKTVKMKRPA